jgi:hypothetical protein
VDASLIYVAPNGSSDNNGSLDYPMDLTNGLSALAEGGTMVFKDGIYRVSGTLNLGKDGASIQTIYRAAEGTRPVITSTDDTPPALNIYGKSKVSGLWIGGTRDTSSQTTIMVGDNVEIVNNTFFGYYGGIAEGGHTGNLYQSNRFVKCGGGGLYHDIYISNANSQARIYDNTHIGGEGYKIHLWHEADNVDVQRNFCAEGYYQFVMQKLDQSAIDNVFWNHTPPAGSWFTVNIGVGTFTHNLFGHRTFGTSKWDHQMNGGENDAGLTVDGLGLIGDRYTDTTTWEGQSVGVGPYNGPGPNVLPAPGTNYTHYAIEDLPALLGYSEAQIDAAVAALIASFSADLATIRADATIEGNFAVLRAVVDAWKVE